MKRISIATFLLILTTVLQTPASAIDSMRAASGGFTTAIHAVLWAAL
jgi:hypothetical protein